MPCGPVDRADLRGDRRIPFDLMTYRYMSYDAASPAAARPQLVQVLRETLASEDVDSPVFELLPNSRPALVPLCSAFRGAWPRTSNRHGRPSGRENCG